MASYVLLEVGSRRRYAMIDNIEGPNNVLHIKFEKISGVRAEELIMWVGSKAMV